jgi:hypothetical protein
MMEVEVIYSVKLIKYEVVRGDFAEYILKIMVAPSGLTFHIRDRYSGMRTWYDDVKDRL